MKKSKNIENKLQQLDDERVLLNKKRYKLLPWIFFIPFITFIVALIFIKSPVAFVFAAIPALIAGIIYSERITSPFKILKSKVRESLLHEFMSIYHPDINYTFFPDKHEGKTIIRNSGLISPDKYLEEDVIKGKMDGVNFYLSEVDLQKKGDKSHHTIFKGLLFKIKIPGKFFPTTQIQSKPNLLKRLFSGFIEHAQGRFWYESQNHEKFDKEMEPLLPFINYLIRKQGDVRIQLKGESITLLLESDMKFLDDPKPTVGQSFMNKQYYENIGKQINSLLFIIESFANDWGTSEIEERLELKSIEYLKQNKRNP